MNFLMSLILGMFPEVLYFTLSLIYIKNLKENKLKLFILISISYILCIMISRYKLLYYICFIFLVYFDLKILYKNKTQIIDIFIIMYFSLYLTLLSYLVYFSKDINTYIICYIINRILLFLPFIWNKNFKNIYDKYSLLWNRNYNKKQPIKSITLRNISLIVMNCIIFVMNMVCIYIIQKSLILKG